MGTGFGAQCGEIPAAGRGYDGEEAARAIGAGATGGGGSAPLTPHLTSPLEGGRDELGEGVGGMGEILATGHGYDGEEAA